MFRKKKTKRLYYPTQSSWYTRPRRRSRVRRPVIPFKKRVADFLKGRPYFLVGGAVFSLLFLFFSLSSYFMVSAVEVVRKNFNIDSAHIENELKPYVGRNLFFISKSEMRNVIQQKFPEFSGIRIRKNFPSKILIDLESYPLVANLKAYYVLPEKEEIQEEDFTQLNKAIEDLSAEDPALAALTAENPLEKPSAQGVFDLGGKDKAPEVHEQKAVLNRIGQAIFDQDENLELIQISIYGLSQPVENREQVISREHMGYLFEMMQYFESQQTDLQITALDYLPVPREARLKTDKNLTLWVSLERPYKDQIDKLTTIYEPAELHKESIAYIDLRIRDKVIYCPRGAKCDKK